MGLRSVERPRTGTPLRRARNRAPAARVLSVEAGLLLAFMLVGRAVLDGRGAAGGSWDYYLLAVLAVLAMGWQNAALRRVAGVPVHTTFVTGILTHLAEESVNGCTHGATCGGRGPPGDPTTSLPSRSDALACTVGSGPATSAGECWVRSSRSTGTCGRSPCRSRSSGAYRRRSRPKGRTSVTTVGVTAGRDRRVGPGPSCPARR
jgi:hypothetical protein